MCALAVYYQRTVTAKRSRCDQSATSCTRVQQPVLGCNSLCSHPTTQSWVPLAQWTMAITPVCAVESTQKGADRQQPACNGVLLMRPNMAATCSQLGRGHVWPQPVRGLSLAQATLMIDGNKIEIPVPCALCPVLGQKSLKPGVKLIKLSLYFIGHRPQYNPLYGPWHEYHSEALYFSL